MVVCVWVRLCVLCEVCSSSSKKNSKTEMTKQRPGKILFNKLINFYLYKCMLFKFLIKVNPMKNIN